MTTIHVLFGGRALCDDVQGVPSQWPPGNLWMPATDLQKLVEGTLPKVALGAVCRPCFLRGRMAIEAAKGEATPREEWHYWMMSFADGSKPEGEQFLGAAIVKAASFMHAHWIVNTLRINPGGEILGSEVPAKCDPPEGWLGRLVTSRDECKRLEIAWHAEDQGS